MRDSSNCHSHALSPSISNDDPVQQVCRGRGYSGPHQNPSNKAEGGVWPHLTGRGPVGGGSEVQSLEAIAQSTAISLDEALLQTLDLRAMEKVQCHCLHYTHTQCYDLARLPHPEAVEHCQLLLIGGWSQDIRPLPLGELSVHRTEKLICTLTPWQQCR